MNWDLRNSKSLAISGATSQLLMNIWGRTVDNHRNKENSSLLDSQLLQQQQCTLKLCSDQLTKPAIQSTITTYPHNGVSCFHSVQLGSSISNQAPTQYGFSRHQKRLHSFLFGVFRLEEEELSPITKGRQSQGLVVATTSLAGVFGAPCSIVSIN